MPENATHLQTSFARGELSPLMNGRVDLRQYATGLARCHNALIGPHGEWKRRTGTQRIAAWEGAETDLQLVPFQAGIGADYALVFTPGRLRIANETGFVTELDSPFDADLASLDWAQTADLMILTHPQIAPQVLKRVGQVSFTLEPFAFREPPFEEISWQPGVRLRKQGDFVQVTGAQLFAVRDVGRVFRIEIGSTWYTGTIRDFVSASAVEIEFSTDQNANLPPDEASDIEAWRFGAFWGANQPAHITFHEDRLCFASTRTHPQTFWLSEAGDYSSFRPSLPDGSVEETNAIFGTLNDRQVNAIVWMVSMGRKLVAGTSGGLWVIQPASELDVLSPRSTQAYRQAANGTSDLRPLIAFNVLLFVGRSGTSLHSAAIGQFVGEMVADDVSVEAEHLMQAGVTHLAFQQNPDSLVWLRTVEGELVGLSFNPTQGLLAWHSHSLGAGGRVEALASLASARSDDLWLLVRRGSEMSLERLSSLTRVHRDGWSAQGAAGASYCSEGETLDLDAGGAGGVHQGQARHPYGVWFRVHESGPFEFGPTSGTYRDTPLLEGEPLPFSGDVSARHWGATWSPEVRLAWRVQGDNPLTLLALGVQIASGD